MFLTHALKQEATRLGFNRIGITPAHPSPTLNAYLAWIESQHNGEMGYLARPDRIARRQDLSVILSQVRSLIVVALDYSTLQPSADLLNDPTRGRISNYAWGVDYHELMTPRLEQLAGWLRAQLPTDEAMQWRVYVDTGPILERSHAQQAGLGFIGKNTMLIHPRAGSHFFLGEILTTFAFDDYDNPQRETMCGNCTRCLNACPTHAFPQPYVLDARKCISYLTIELKNTIPANLRPHIGRWVYGCDVCQQICPWNRFAVQTLETDFCPATPDQIAPPLMGLLTLTDESFAERFAQSPILRIGRARLVRNACVAAGNSGRGEFLEILGRLAHGDESVLVREHATWAIQQLMGQH